jgi:hypothetical protein
LLYQASAQYRIHYPETPEPSGLHPQEEMLDGKRILPFYSGVKLQPGIRVTAHEILFVAASSLQLLSTFSFDRI